MKILEVNIPKEKSTYGLDNINMSKLGHIVVLAGKNGSGKTRILNCIREITMDKPSAAIIKQWEAQSLDYVRAIEKYKTRVEGLKKAGEESFGEKILKLESELEKYNKTLGEVRKSIEWNHVVTDKLYDSYNIVPFVPKSLDLVDCNNYPLDGLINHANVTKNIGMNGLRDGALAKIQVVHNRWFTATHQNFDAAEADKLEAINEYQRLKEIIKIFLGADLGQSLNNEATIFGFPLGKANLSDGQKILIQFCVALHSQGKSLNELILFLDEPENHLHPSAIIEIIERLTLSANKGQIWISTHSIPLLSHFDPASIWFVERGSISHAGKIPERVLRSLLGDENQVEKLRDFISLPSQLALNRYAYESLFAPVSVSTGSGDPQLLQVKSEIQSVIGIHKKIKILDYGAGKGRVLAGILEDIAFDKNKILESVDYVAFDKFCSDKSDCLSVLQEIYPDWKLRYFNDMSELRTHHDDGSFNIILMCNVFHEIDPKDWLGLFSKNRDINSLLNDTGLVLIVEDHQIPVGEKAYQKGFIVLDSVEIKKLFCMNSEEYDFSSSKEERLKCHRIPKKCLMRITPESRIDALEFLRQKAMEKILDIRQSEPNYKNGKKHGFWVQQLANTHLALNELTKS